jgi:hypothetical protein
MKQKAFPITLPILTTVILTLPYAQTISKSKAAGT